MAALSSGRYGSVHSSCSGLSEARERTWLPVRLAMATLVIWAAFAWPCRAADDFQLTARARPGQDLTLAFPTPVRTESGAKYFLRLTRLATTAAGATPEGAPAASDAPLEPEQLGRRLARVRLPQLQYGQYRAELVTDSGSVLGAGSNTLRVLASDPPRITKIVPPTGYPDNGYSLEDAIYSFEVAGENLGEPEDITIKINDVPLTFERRIAGKRGLAPSEKECDRRYPCLIAGRRSLRVFGVARRDLLDHSWPLKIQLQVEGLPSNEEQLRLSWVSRTTPVAISLAVLVALAALVFLLSRRPGEKGKPGTVFNYVLIEAETNTYSLSHLQFMLWSSAAVLTYVYLATSQSLVQGNWVMPKVPQGLPALLGLSAGTSVLAAGATRARGSKGAGPGRPGLADFISSGGVFAPERLQFLLWTLLGVAAFVSTTLLQDPATVTELPKIPDEYLPLMGVSSLGYLGGKLVRKAGPVIRQVLPSEKPGGIRIIGTNLSRHAQVQLGGDALPASRVVVPGGDAEFVHELVTSGMSSASAAAITIRVTNPDGQSAEFELGSPGASVVSREEGASGVPATPPAADAAS